MFSPTSRRPGRGFALLIAGILVCSAGCGAPSATPGKPKAVGSSDPAKGSTKGPTSDGGDSTQFIGEFLTALNNKSLSPDLFTPAFKKKVALPKPGNSEDAQLGYDPGRFRDYLARAEAGTYKESFNFIKTDDGPWVLGELISADKRPAGFVLHLTPAKNPSGWLVDLFYISPIHLGYVADNLGPDQLGAELAVHCFMDNLLGGELLLAESEIAPTWKIREYPSNTSSDAKLGYSQPLVLQKLRDWRPASTTEYAITKREFKAAAPAQFEVIVLDKDKAVKETLDLRVSKNSSSEWQIEDVTVK